MKRSLAGAFVLMVFFLFNCGGGGGSGADHSLEGEWAGYMFEYGELGLNMTIDGSGNITELTGDDVPPFLEGNVDDNPPIYSMTWDLDPSGTLAFSFLTDSGQEHGALVYLGPAPVNLIGTLEKGGTTATNFFPNDILGTWSGYGYAYSQSALDFAPFSPVSVEAVDGDPSDIFTVSLPGGATITGEIGHLAYAFYQGTAVTGADMWIIMSPDKQFVTVEVIPSDYSGDVQDLVFFALRRY